MRRLIIVMGVSGAGKTHFVREHFPQWAPHFEISSYQQRLIAEAGNPESMDFLSYYNLLAEANEDILQAVIQALQAGEDVVMEHTLYKAMRRVAYIEAIREAVPEVTIDIYVITPSHERLRANIELSERLESKEYPRILRELETQVEFPNIAEGYAQIYKVTDMGIEKCNEAADETAVDRAHKKLEEHVRQREELTEQRSQHENLLNELNEKGFYHICEVCGEKKWLKPDEAFNAGWDYPPRMGAFGVISPRTCGKCQMVDTVWWKLNTKKGNNGEGISLGDLSTLSDREKQVVTRVLREPYSLLEDMA